MSSQKVRMLSVMFPQCHLLIHSRLVLLPRNQSQLTPAPRRTQDVKPKGTHSIRKCSPHYHSLIYSLLVPRPRTQSRPAVPAGSKSRFFKICFLPVHEPHFALTEPDLSKKMDALDARLATLTGTLGHAVAHLATGTLGHAVADVDKGSIGDRFEKLEEKVDRVSEMVLYLCERLVGGPPGLPRNSVHHPGPELRGLVAERRDVTSPAPSSALSSVPRTPSPVPNPSPEILPIIPISTDILGDVVSMLPDKVMAPPPPTPNINLIPPTPVQSQEAAGEIQLQPTPQPPEIEGGPLRLDVPIPAVLPDTIPDTEHLPSPIPSVVPPAVDMASTRHPGDIVADSRASISPIVPPVECLKVTAAIADDIPEDISPSGPIVVPSPMPDNSTEEISIPITTHHPTSISNISTGDIPPDIPADLPSTLPTPSAQPPATFAPLSGPATRTRSRTPVAVDSTLAVPDFVGARTRSQSRSKSPSPSPAGKRKLEDGSNEDKTNKKRRL